MMLSKITLFIITVGCLIIILFTSIIIFKNPELLFKKEIVIKDRQKEIQPISEKATDSTVYLANLRADSITTTSDIEIKYIIKIKPNSNYNFMKSDTLFKAIGYSFRGFRNEGISNLSIQTTPNEYYSISKYGIDKLTIIDIEEKDTIEMNFGW